MRPNYNLLRATFESYPGWREIFQETGCTPAMATAIAMKAITDAPTPAARDRIFSNYMHLTGVNTSGFEAFDKGTEAVLNDATNRVAMDKLAQRMSDESRRSHMYSSPERIKHVLTAGRQSSLTQGLNDRLRDRDEQLEKHEPQAEKGPRAAQIRSWADDERDRRSALSAAMLSAPRERGVLKLDEEHENVRDTLRAAFDRTEEHEQLQDPFDNPTLGNLADAV